MDGGNTKVTSGVRRATTADTMAILGCLKPALAELPYRVPPVDAGDSMRWIGDVCSAGIITVAFVGPHVVGSLGMQAMPFPWNRAHWRLENVWYYVSPLPNGKRPPGVADALFRCFLREYQALAPDPATLPPLFFGITSGIEVEVKERWLQRYGFRHVGGHYVLERAA